MSFTLQDLVASLAAPGCWDRGLELFRDRAVLDAHVSGHGMEARLASERGFEQVSLSFRHHHLSSRCTCANHSGLCEHAVACLLMLAEEKPELIAFLRPSRPTIGTSPQAEAEAAPDTASEPLPAALRLRNPQLTMESLRHLLRADAPECRLSLHAEAGIGTMESQWNQVTLTARLQRGDVLYAQGNIRRLIETGRGAGGMILDDFAPQEQQVMRFLVTQAEFGTTSIQLRAPVLADLFHALGGFESFFAPNGRLQIHAERLETVLEVTENSDGSQVRARLLLPGAGHLPAGRPTYILGRAGYWIGFGTEYWWLPGFFPSAWLQLFLHARGIQVSDAELVRLHHLCAQHRLQSRIVPAGQHAEMRLRQGACTPVLTLDWDSRGILARLAYRYGDTTVGPDSRTSVWDGHRFVRRDLAAEAQATQRLRTLGLRPQPGRRDRLRLTDLQALWQLVQHRLGELEAEWDLYWTPRFSARRQSTGDVRLVLRPGEETQSWFETRCEILGEGGRPVPWDEVARAVREGQSLITLTDGTLLRLPGEVLRVLQAMDGRGRAREGGRAFRFERHAAVPLAAEIAPYWQGERATWQEAAEQLRNRSRLPQRPVPPGLWARLRLYQREGVRWLQLLQDCGVHGILADEMGLGKTVQTLALVASRVLDGVTEPSLVVCPTSLVENWLMEATRFTPELRCIAVTGNARHPLIGRLGQYHLVVTSYALLRRDIEAYEGIPFDLLVLDEAQHIKNPYTANARTCKRLSAAQRLVLTGTPLENSLAEIWSLFDFLMPGYLGTHRAFRQAYEQRVAAGQAAAVAAELAPLLHPLVLRRSKRDVCAELPPKLEQVLYCEMPEEQRRVYETLLAAGRQMLERARDDWQSAGADVLGLLLRLRQVCCHPGLLPADLLPDSSAALPSAKLELAREVILEAIDSGHRILLFSQFTSVLALFPDWLQNQGIPFEYLDGSTPDRQTRIDRFNQDPSIPLFLLSLKAGGTGLNLTGADTVIHYDPWWNPMVEDQATDRAHRIGQSQTVTSVKLVVRYSIEERILQLQASKRELFNRILEGAPASLAAFTADDIAFLLDPPPASTEAG